MKPKAAFWKQAILFVSFSLSAGILAPNSLTAQRIGEPALPPRVDHWIQVPKINASSQVMAIDDWETNQIYVVEFWATWCAPCIKGFDQLSLWQDKYRNKRVTFIGITNEKLPLVIKFLRQPYGTARKTHFDRILFASGSDPDGSTLKGLIPEPLRESRPVVAIIDASGHLAWVGTDSKMIPKVLDQIIEKKWDAKDFGKKLANRLKRERLKQQILGEEDWQLAKREFWDDSEFLSRLAFAMAFNYGNKIKNADPEMAKTLAERAVELTERNDAYPLHVLARIRFNSRKLESAIRLQKRALELEKAKGEKATYESYYRTTLKSYQEADKGPSPKP